MPVILKGWFQGPGVTKALSRDLGNQYYNYKDAFSLSDSNGAKSVGGKTAGALARMVLHQNVEATPCILYHNEFQEMGWWNQFYLIMSLKKQLKLLIIFQQNEYTTF